MSHVVQIQTEVRDPVAVTAATNRLGLERPVLGKFKLFAAEASGWAVKLPRWRYPVVCDTASGKVEFDNYEGRWGEPAELDRFLQAYAVEKAKLEARRAGHAVIEQSLADGSIKLTVQLGGAA
jgi:hypothetical protein